MIHSNKITRIKKTEMCDISRLLLSHWCKPFVYGVIIKLHSVAVSRDCVRCVT
jgi:hypothetical protein